MKSRRKRIRSRAAPRVRKFDDTGAEQKIISMPRAMPKIAIFEEAARTLDIPGGVKMVQEYYRQMRKFGCNILAVVQQYDIIKDSPVRGAMIGNSKMFLEAILGGVRV